MNISTPPITTKEDASGPLADVVFDRVLEAIYQGRLAPGSVINEVALAQEFGVSRGPVREAVRRLQGIQLVTREPYIKARVVTLSAESALELFQMRMALEGVACNLATRRMSDEEIAQLLVELEQDRQRRLAAASDGAPPPVSSTSTSASCWPAATPASSTPCAATSITCCASIAGTPAPCLNARTTPTPSTGRSCAPSARAMLSWRSRSCVLTSNAQHNIFLNTWQKGHPALPGIPSRPHNALWSSTT